MESLLIKFPLQEKIMSQIISDSDASDLSCRSQRVSRLGRCQHVPSRYRCHSGTDSDDNDGTFVLYCDC